MTLSELYEDRAIAVVRVPQIPSPVELCRALAEGGIRSVEFTFTTPGVEALIREAADAASEHGAIIGAGTVTDADTARRAIDAGAQFIVTPGLSAAVAEVATAAGIPFLLGAMTPSELMRALDLGSEAVKIFPAGTMGSGFLKDLRGPFPNVTLVPSGGLHAGNAREYIDAGASAVTAGSSVVGAAAVAAADWDGIRAAAAEFTAAALGSEQAVGTGRSVGTGSTAR
ncbi:bifunctional 4-hydroxy-2-oxoglutarate aldolase/2-dehydro-3-deoxy-phosphogluconate aldolase [Plantibacter sp. YIM 135347]|uniref:bifunctional 4-hydroxy-2-oxoglutarate aldolase/2-dehydro-3-deoxy-phosphogluconate aldolase n=1 Tax=Plantibacter sp. YIM 135347 TaxID=3423919 RepID=UPI003D347425